MPFRNDVLSAVVPNQYFPITGRWLSKDPIGISGGLNQYVFVGNAPVVRRDPSGLLDWNALNDPDAWYDAVVEGQGALTQPIVAPPESGPPSAWNPSGHAKVWRGGKASGYVFAGGEAGRVTLSFDNGMMQDYGYCGGGIGLGNFGGGFDLGGNVYGVYHPNDFTGSFWNIDYGYGLGQSWSWWGRVASMSTGGTTPGNSFAFQGYWPIGIPYTK